MSRYKVSYNKEPIGEADRLWDATELAVTHMRKAHVSPVEVWDSESTLAPEFQRTEVRIQAYEGPRDVVEARALIRSHDR